MNSSFLFFLQQIQSKTTVHNNTLAFDDVNEDCLLLIFAHLEWADLGHLRQVNKFIMSLADIEIKSRFKTTAIDFRTEKEFAWISNYIRISNASNVLAFLNKFGHVVQRMGIRDMESFASKQEIHAIYKLIEEQCSETLVQLNLFQSGVEFLSTIRKPFKSIEKVILFGRNRYMNGGSDQLTLNELFPGLRNLTFFCSRPENISKIVLNYPHLEHFCVFIDMCEEPETCMNERVVMDLIRRNLQIRSLNLYNPSTNLLRMIAVEMPMLKHLEIKGYEDQRKDDIHFKHVKSLTVSDFYIESRWSERITFSSELEEFNTDIQSVHKYIAFLKHHKQLKRIQIGKEYPVINEEFKRLASANLEAFDVVLSVDDSIEAENIYELIKNSKQLKRLKLAFKGNELRLNNGDKISTDDLKVLLIKEFPNEWTIYLEHKTDTNEVLVLKKHIELNYF